MCDAVHPAARVEIFVCLDFSDRREDFALSEYKHDWWYEAMRLTDLKNVPIQKNEITGICLV